MGSLRTAGFRLQREVPFLRKRSQSDPNTVTWKELIDEIKGPLCRHQEADNLK